MFVRGVVAGRTVRAPGLAREHMLERRIGGVRVMSFGDTRRPALMHFRGFPPAETTLAVCSSGSLKSEGPLPPEREAIENRAGRRRRADRHRAQGQSVVSE